MGGRRTSIIATSVAFGVVAVLAAIVIGVHAIGSGGTTTPQARAALATASSTPLVMPTPTATPTVVAPAPTSALPGSTTTKTPAPRAHRTVAPVAFDSRVSARPGVVVGDVAVRLADVTSHLPGETSGASYLVTVTVTNNGSTPVDLSTAVVNLAVGADQTPAVATSSASTPVKATLAAHRSAHGTYVFRRPAGAAAPLRVEVDLGATSTVVPFQGPAPSAG